jgi:hypothetical protein
MPDLKQITSILFEEATKKRIYTNTVNDGWFHTYALFENDEEILRGEFYSKEPATTEEFQKATGYTVGSTIITV